jgi:DNA-binding IclR family transcriptional regulator
MLMVKPALAATRAVRVLDFLALHPGQAFSLKEISDACALNAPSLLAVITALVDGGYLLRHPSHKTYTLGPGVVALSHAALVQHPNIEAAQRELGVLEGDLKAHCYATVLMGTTLVAVAMAGRPRQAAASTQTGTRLPFVAPFGAAFAAFGSAQLRQTWLGRSVGVRRRSLEKALDEVARRGFAVVEERPARIELAQVLQQLAEEPGNEAGRARLDALLDDLADALIDPGVSRRKRIDVASINVPVFSPVGDVVMSLSASGFARPLSPDQITEAGHRTRAAASAITLSAFGSLGSMARLPQSG